MIQVRCPECGFLQTLSEERFLTISEDFLNCPHCHARLPKKWAPSHPDNVPEEARHKIIAFSRRILNGGAVNRAVVTTLEALVRRYGQMESSLKALGVGYGSLGEHKKAEEFFSMALQESPDDTDMLRWLARVKLALEKYNESYATNAKVMEMVGNDLQDEDVATAALSLIGLGRMDEAQSLVDAHPNLNSNLPVVKQVLKRLGQGSPKKANAWATAFSRFRELVSPSSNLRFKQLREKATGFIKNKRKTNTLIRSNPARLPSSKRSARWLARPLPDKTIPRRLFLEYWIYSNHDVVPDWDAVKRGLTEVSADEPSLKPCFAQLDHLIQINALSIEYVRKEEAEDLFSYPEDVLPRNSRGLESQDVERVVNARLIVRLRFVQKVDDPVSWLKFMVFLVDNVRSAVSGVVQDVISHTLWGESEWKKNIKAPFTKRLDFHINCEAVEESNGLWLHTHGMQKFGLPELELESVPNEFEFEASRLVFMIVQTLLDMGQIQGSHAGPFPIQSAPYSFTLTMRKPDDEAHFPGGSAIINAFVSGGFATGLEGLKQVLARIGANIHMHASSDSHNVPQQNNQLAILRQRMLEAHRQAMRRLPYFKKSFRNMGTKHNYVHAVKVRFDSETGNHEWMWVSLDKWKGRTVEGFLENEPIHLKKLKKGNRINMSDRDIFDWVIVADGTILDGGFTEALRLNGEHSSMNGTA